MIGKPVDHQNLVDDFSSNEGDVFPRKRPIQMFLGREVSARVEHPQADMGSAKLVKATISPGAGF